jgi:hypothetical protein
MKNELSSIQLILGNFTFLEKEVLIHRIDKEIPCKTISEAYKLGNNFLNKYEAFLIPLEFNGKITEDFC